MLESARAVPLETSAVPKPKRIRTFIVRVWVEDLGEGHTEWRGRVQDVLTGQVRFFRGWEQLTKTILEMLANRTCDTREVSEGDLPTSSEKE